MRLYRGLDRPYRPERVVPNHGTIAGTDFTDCVFTALLYARGPRGVVLVLDVSETRRKVTEEQWGDGRARRLMVWGRFDEHIVTIFEAKELRAQIRRKGVASMSEEGRAAVLRDWVEREVTARLRSSVPLAFKPGHLERNGYQEDEALAACQRATQIEPEN